MTRIDAAFVILALVVATTLVARRFRTPGPVVFAVSGMAAGLVWQAIPGAPAIRMPADLVLFAFLPPLLTVAAYALPLESFRRNLLPIGVLAIGLVAATMVVAAALGHAFAGLPWAAALLLGAIVAPPDPVAATTVASKTGLAHRLVVILEGEGLVNDAIAIIAYGIALDAATSGDFSWPHAATMLATSAPLGVAIGLVLGWSAKWMRRRADSVPVEVAISLVTPYLAYHLAERTGGSGVLAVVALGFMLRRYATAISGPAARLAARTVWGAIRFASTGLVFLFLGLLMGQSIASRPPLALIGAGFAVAGGVVVLRMAWLHALPPLIERLQGRDTPRTDWRERTVLGWSGMRGIVSLALALALPAGLVGDENTRYTIIVITLVVIVCTLVLQGVTLVPLVKRLAVGDPDREAKDERRARRDACRAGIVALRRARRDGRLGDGEHARLEARVRAGAIGVAEPGMAVDGRDGAHDALLDALSAQRDRLEHLRESGRLGETLAERLANELDIDMMSAIGESDRITGAGEA